MKSLLILLSLSMLVPISESFGQGEELKQKLEAFATDHEENYEKKHLNITDPELGSIDETTYEWREKFVLKSKEKKENSLGRKSYQKFYFAFYAYDNLEDRQYALKDWLANFIEGKSIRGGRTVKTYEYATPTIILINDTEIMICNYKCSVWSEENFKYWRKTLLKYFGNENTMVIELECDGPLEWTKNSPKIKNRKQLF